MQIKVSWDIEYEKNFPKMGKRLILTAIIEDEIYHGVSHLSIDPSREELNHIINCIVRELAYKIILRNLEIDFDYSDIKDF